jgi:hypothetical protein
LEREAQHAKDLGDWNFRFVRALSAALKARSTTNIWRLDAWRAFFAVCWMKHWVAADIETAPRFEIFFGG